MAPRICAPADHRGFFVIGVPQATPHAASEVTNVMGVLTRSCGTVEVVTKPSQNDYIDWDKGREGYIDLPPKPTYLPLHATARKPSGPRYRFRISTEERLGSLIAAAGTIWATYAATVDYAGLWRLQILPPGPLEVCALGILVWLHAKWRRATNVD